MPITENELLACTAVWIGGAALILWAVWMFISYKTKGVRRRQKQFRQDFYETHGESQDRRRRG